MSSRDRGPALQNERMRLRRLRQQERLRRRLRAQLRRGQYAHAERTLDNLDVTDDDVPILRAHADRVTRIAERLRELSS
jgi:hypothetical protein